MANRTHQPLIFSIDDRLESQQLNRLDLSSRNLQRIEPFMNNVRFNVVVLDQNQIGKLEYLDELPHLIQVKIIFHLNKFDS